MRSRRTNSRQKTTRTMVCDSPFLFHIITIVCAWLKHPFPFFPKKIKKSTFHLATGNDEQEMEERDEAGPSGVQTAGPSSSVAVAPNVMTVPLAAAPRPAPAEKYASEIETLVSEFPGFDRELLKGLLEDQAGDVLDVRAMLRVRETTPHFDRYCCGSHYQKIFEPY